MISPVQLLLLQKIPYVGTGAIEATIAYLSSKKMIFPESDSGIVNLLKEIKKSYRPLRVPTTEAVQGARILSQQIVANSEKHGISMISYFDSAYPKSLKNIDDRPLLLHYNGDLKALDLPTIAVIGSRNCSAYASEHGRKVANTVVGAGFTIVSGLATGCDTIGHTAAVNQGKPTVAVLASGLHGIYPAENKVLANEILESGGLLLSEYAFGTTITKNALKERNRMITGLSKAVVVLETGIAGGTMHAVAYATEQKKPLACLYLSATDAVTSTMEGNKILIDTKHAVKLDSIAATARFIKSVAEPQEKEMVIG